MPLRAGGTLPILSSLASGAAGASPGAQVSTLAQGLTTQVTTLANRVGTVISGCKNSGATVNLVPLQRELQTLLNACFAMWPNLADQCPTQITAQAPIPPLQQPPTAR